MSRYVLRGLCAAGMTALSTGALFAAAPVAHETLYATRGGVVAVPASSQVLPGDAGVRAHTNIRIFFVNGVREPSSAPPPNAETPGSVACVYNLVKQVSGCPIKTATTLPTGGAKLVLIVDAYDDPTALNDLTVFSKQFGLPAPTSSNFEVVYASGTKPGQDSSGGWELEESLDIEYAHAMAPNAKVVLVEAASSSLSDLLTANTVAAGLATAAGGGEVSNSWGSGEFSGESSYESTFTGANVVFFASTGDSPGTSFPSVLQNVVGAGGTTIDRSSGNYTGQTAWSSGGGGKSSQITIPAYQKAERAVKKIVGKTRGVPDFSWDANPSSGVAIYDTTPYNGQKLDWLQVGGTSVSSPSLAAAINAAGSFAASTAAELTTVYGGYTNTSNWTDVTSGSCGTNSAKKGYDLCTGVGVPNGYAGK